MNILQNLRSCRSVPTPAQNIFTWKSIVSQAESSSTVAKTILLIIVTKILTFGNTLGHVHEIFVELCLSLPTPFPFGNRPPCAARLRVNMRLRTCQWKGRRWPKWKDEKERLTGLVPSVMSSLNSFLHSEPRFLFPTSLGSGKVL